MEITQQWQGLTLRTYTECTGSYNDFKCDFEREMMTSFLMSEGKNETHTALMHTCKVTYNDHVCMT